MLDIHSSSGATFLLLHETGAQVIQSLLIRIQSIWLQQIEWFIWVHIASKEAGAHPPPPFIHILHFDKFGYRLPPTLTQPGSHFSCKLHRAKIPAIWIKNKKKKLDDKLLKNSLASVPIHCTYNDRKIFFSFLRITIFTGYSVECKNLLSMNLKNGWEHSTCQNQPNPTSQMVRSIIIL